MSASTYAALGDKAKAAKNYSLAITHYTSAILASPSPLYYLSRSSAYISSADYPSALQDASLAYHAAVSRSSRPLIAESQYRRAVALYRMGQYASADCAARWSLQLHAAGPASKEDKETTDVDAEGNYTLKKEAAMEEMRAVMGNLDANQRMTKSEARNKVMLIQTFRTQCLGALERIPKGDKAWKPDVTKVPVVKKDDEKSKREEAKPTVAAPMKTAGNALKTETVRTDFYQSVDKVMVSLFIKGAKKESVKVMFVPSGDNETVSSEIHIAGLPLDGSEDAAIRLQLAGPVNIAESTHRVAPVKIELTLKKAPQTKWPAAFSAPLFPLSGPTSGVASTSTSAPALSSSAPASSSNAPIMAAGKTPSYPTSSRKGPINWDAITKDEKDGDDKDINTLFKTLYAGATDEQKRAMQKSFIESNGTALSTDWRDVGSRKVDVVPVDGVNVKPWK